MANDNALISFALMSLEWENNSKDYYDMIIPFVLYAISDKSADVISITAIQITLKDEFGINVPKNTIEYMLRRLSQKEYGYVVIKNNIFFYSEKKIDVSEFKQNRRDAQSNHSQVLSSLYDFLLNVVKCDFNKTEVENSLIKYLCRYGYAVIDNNGCCIKNENDIWDSRIGQFIEYSYQNNHLIFDYISDIVKGGMLASCIHMKNASVKNSNIRDSFKNTQVFFDTALLIYTLGYSGKALQNSCYELKDLLKEVGAEICYFEHNVLEVEGVLDAYVARYNNDSLDTSYNYDYLMEMNIKPHQIMQYKARIHSELKELGFIRKEMPDFACNKIKEFDIKEFDAYLQKHINYNKESRRINDVNSIVSMYLLRKRSDYKRIENCQSIFATANLDLVYYTNEYFKKDRGDEYLAIIDDTLLTSIVWIKSTVASETPPTLKIIADAYASQAPNSKFWKNAIENICQLNTQGFINEEDTINLKYDIFSRKNIYEFTSGDPNKINSGNIQELVHEIYRKRHQELYKENSDLMSENKELMEEHQELIYEKARKYFNYLGVWVFFYLVNKFWLLIESILILILGLVINSLLTKETNIVIGITVIIEILNILLKRVITFNVQTIKKKLTRIFCRLYKHKVKEIINNSESKYQEEIFQCVYEEFLTKRCKLIEKTELMVKT